ncbi:unnamed protein product [Litomosoides sigmodontis]|uniref:Uncharacterized protein n=1 Tax=Litomosoides sigmodontis TaxID=42156 RepID=A0A3P6UVI1_LITSI|nr:unnamed protein product [Litomosoides sigmodontis]
MKTETANSAAPKPKGKYEKSEADSSYSHSTSNQYDNISVRSNNPMLGPVKRASRHQSLSKNNANILEKLPENASKLEILHRFYLGQRSRSVSISSIQFAQNFRLYHELPENVNNLDNLKQYAPLYIVFVNNDLEYRHLPVQECLMNGKRRFFVECGDRNIVPFKTLEYLIRHYANTFAYTDSQGRKSRFPDNPVDESINDFKKVD